mgnify:CR=1 FL=1
MQKKVQIISDGSQDLSSELSKEKDIEVVPFYVSFDGEHYYKEIEEITVRDFYQQMVDHPDVFPKTSMPSVQDFYEVFEKSVKENIPVICICITAKFSGSLQSATTAKGMILEEYPEAKVIVVDTLCACMGEAMLLYYALKQKEAGKTIEEVAQWAEENKLHVCHNVTVDDLFHLHRGGRVSKTAAVLGTMVKVKPIIHMDDNGALQVIGKERGRKKSLHKIVDMAVERSKGWDNEIIMITHGDCLEDAEYVAKLVREKMGVENVFIHNIGTVIGSHTGPGVVATFCMGNKR